MTHDSSHEPGRAEALTAIPVKPGCRYSLSSDLHLAPRSQQLEIGERFAWEPLNRAKPETEAERAATTPGTYRLALTATPPAHARDAEVAIGAILGTGQAADFTIDSVTLTSSCP